MLHKEAPMQEYIDNFHNVSFYHLVDIILTFDKYTDITGVFSNWQPAIEVCLLHTVSYACSTYTCIYSPIISHCLLTYLHCFIYCLHTHIYTYMHIQGYHLIIMVDDEITCKKTNALMPHWSKGNQYDD